MDRQPSLTGSTWAAVSSTFVPPRRSNQLAQTVQDLLTVVALGDRRDSAVYFPDTVLACW